MHAAGELERAKTNVMVYMHNSTGIGEHSDIVEAIQEELDKMAAANDRMEMLDKFFNDDDEVIKNTIDDLKRLGGGINNEDSK